MEKKSYSTSEVADILGVHRNTISKLVKDGKLHPYRITEGTGRMRFTEEDIENFKSTQDLTQIQPNAIFKQYAKIINGWDSIPEPIFSILKDKFEKIEFMELLESANIERIFGQYLKNVSEEDYATALSLKSETWIGETFANLYDSLENNRKESPYYRSLINYRSLISKLSIGIGSIDMGKLEKPYISMLIYHGSNSDIVISGTLQQYLSNTPKGLIVMEKSKAESFFINLRELTVNEYAKMCNNDTYSNYLYKFMFEVYKVEVDEDSDGILD